MSSKLEIEISMSSTNHVITPRRAIISIINGSETIINDISPSRSAVQERLKTIEGETPPKFKFNWTPPQEYKSVFSNLKKKGKKELSKIFFTFFIKDGSQIIWNESYKADQCQVLDARTRGRGSSKVETVEVECESFKPPKPKK